jgi:hypothetical protein
MQMTTHTDDSLGSIPAGEAGEPVAWLVHGGRIYVDRALISRKSAELSLIERDDGSIISPLYLAPPSAAASKLPDDAIREWAERHQLDMSSMTDMRCAFEDARSLTLGAAAPAGGETTLSDRAKHYEECAVIAENTIVAEYEGVDCYGDKAADAIRRAAGARHA